MFDTEEKPAAGSSHLKTLLIISAIVVVIAFMVYLEIVEQWDARTAVLRIMGGIIGGGVFVLIYALVKSLFKRRTR